MTTWSNALLDTVTDRGSGHTPSQSHPAYWDGNVDWLSLADSSRLDRGLVQATSRRISELGLRHSSAILHPAGTVVMSRDAAVGKSGVLASPMAVSQHFIAWNCGPKGILDPWFLYYWLQLNKGFFERMAVGSTIKTLGLGVFRRLQLSYPPLPQQRKIAAILRAWDDAIDRMAALHRASIERHRALVGAALAASGDARRVPLSRVTKPITARNDAGETRVLTSSAARGLVDQVGYFNKAIASADLSGYILLQQGDFAYNRSSSKGSPYGAIRRLMEHQGGVISTLYLCFRVVAPEVADADYLDHAFRAGVLDPQLALISHEGARSHGLLNVARSDFFELTVPLPSIERQRSIAGMLATSEREIALLDREIELLRTQKRGIMQKLLTGEIRVPEAEEVPDD